ncbi:MAG: adenosylmethionine decarboxylase [DPANN group archaeon]|nr:adenosylmethionine decarboxylase [DPANN group archaeon]
MYGPHLMIEGYGCNEETLNSIDNVYELLDNLPEKINMTKMTRPYVVRQRTPTDVGVTGFVIIAESHIAIHTFPKNRHFTMDIYSCKDFDIESAMSHVIETFKPAEIDKHIVYRGNIKNKAEQVNAYILERLA